MENTFDVAIIGSGPAGCSAAIYSARSALKTIMFTGLEMGGQLMQTTDVENYPGIKKITGPDLMEGMIDHAKICGSAIEYDLIEKVEEKQDGTFSLTTSSGKEFVAKAIIASTGANAKWLNREDEEKFKNHGISACATCDGAFFKNKDVAVIGGGSTALTEALHMTHHASKVYVIHRREIFRAEQPLQERVKNHPKIELVLNYETHEIGGNEDPIELKYIKVKHKDTNEIKKIDIEGLFVAIGHSPNTSLFKDFIETDSEGYLSIYDKVFTSKRGVFACGDVSDKKYKQAIVSAGYGCVAALEAIEYVNSL